MIEELDFTRARQRDYDDLDFYDVDLTSARSSSPLEVPLQGTVLYVAINAFDSENVISTSKSVGTAVASFNEPNGKPFELVSGIAYKLRQPFDRIFLRNAAQSSKMMRIYSTVETDIAPFSSQLKVIGDVGATISDSSDVSVLAGATTQILPVNADRKIAYITNLISNGTDIRVGTSSTGAARGLPVFGGETYTFETKSSIYVYNPSAGTIKIANMEINA